MDNEKYKDIEDDKYYDSDLNSDIGENFQSDNEPPKDELRERKLLSKQKFLKIYKAIYHLGNKIDKPAPYDLVTIRFAKFDKKPTSFKLQSEFVTYNLGLEGQYKDLENLVVSMKKSEVALFQLEYLATNQSDNLKVLEKADYILIELKEWITTIDLDGDKLYMKQIIQKGEGGDRVSESDEIVWSYEIQTTGTDNAWRIDYNSAGTVQLDSKLIKELPISVWRLLRTMKNQEVCKCLFPVDVFRSIESEHPNAEKHCPPAELIPKSAPVLSQEPVDLKPAPQIEVTITVYDFQKVDDVFFDKTLLKKTLRKGNSTTKPDDSSEIYFAIQFRVPSTEAGSGWTTLQRDNGFEVEEDDLQKLQNMDLAAVGIRKHYLDEYTISKALKYSLMRIKPLEVAQLTCYSPGLLTYGEDSAILKSRLETIPQKVVIIVKIFNFSQGKTAFNMTPDQKVFHANRKRTVALRLLKENSIKKAKETFQEISAYFDYGLDTPEDQAKVEEVRVATMMNVGLCCFKLGEYPKTIQLCKKVKDLRPSEKVIYRLASAYKESGQAKLGLTEIENWQQSHPEITPELKQLKDELEAKFQQYLNKSKQVYSSMFAK